MIEKPPIHKLVQLENLLMQALLAGNDPMLATLRTQYTSSTIAKRDFTGVGFFIHYSVAENVQRVTPSNFDIRDVSFEFVRAESTAMAILAIRNGAINYLEACTIHGDWPKDSELKKIVYSKLEPGSQTIYESASERDMEVVGTYWSVR